MVSPISIPGFPSVHTRQSAATCDAALESRLAFLEACVAALPSLITTAIDQAFADSLTQFRRDMFFRGAGEGLSAPLAGDHHGSPAIDPIQLPPSPICAEGAQSQLSPSVVQAPPLISSSPLLRALATSTVKPHSKDSAAATVLLPELKTGLHASTMTSTLQLLHEHLFSDTMKNGHEVVLNLSIISATSEAKFPSLLTDKYGAYMKDKFGWVHWYLVGKFVKKDVYALELFEKMSEKSSEDKMEISHWRNLYNFEFTNYIWNPSGCTIIVKLQGISAAFHHYATSEPQIGNELFQFKNVEFDQVAKGIENVGVRWISLPTASILILLFGEIIARCLYDLVPICSATKTYLMNAISKNVVRLREIFRLTNPVLSQQIACYMSLALGWIMIKGFADDEIYVQLHESVRRCDVYLVQPTCPPANEKFMELLVMSGACRLTASRRIHEYLFKVGFTGNSQVTNTQLDLYAKSEANIITGISYTAIKITIQHWINFGFAYTCSLFNFLNLETSIYSTIETSSVLSSCVRQPLAENQKQGPDLSMYSCGKTSWAIWFKDNCFLVNEMVYLAEMKQYFLDDAHLSDALPLNPRKSLIAQTSYFQQVISVVANNLTCSLNLEIDVKLLLQWDGTTPASILLFLFHGMYFKECEKSGTKPYVTETEQQCVSHHIFSHMIGKKAILLGDMAHISVLVTASVISSPSEYAYMVKTTSHKSPSNVPKLVESLFEKGYDIVSGGIENHLVWVNLRDNGIDGSGAEKVLESVHIAAIRNNVPGYVFAVVLVGVLSIESPFSFETTIGVEGLEIDEGYFFPQFATNPEKLFVEFENAGVLITDQKISRMFKVGEDCKATGILVMVITGDNQNIAEAICREIGVFGADEDIHPGSFTGKKSMRTLRAPKAHLRQGDDLLFSRVEPKHKQKIVRLLKEDGEVVAMTVDGVNDAPTLKLADIGIAMDISGTEVLLKLKESAAAFKQVSTISFLSLEDKANFQGGNIVMNPICN